MKERAALANMGSNPPQQRYRGMPVPWWFNIASAELFGDLDLHESDIIISSGPKMGTTWATKIISSLLYDFDDEGNLKEGAYNNEIPNRIGQTYPDACFPTRQDKEEDVDGILRRVPNGLEKMNATFGDFIFEDLANQPHPRLFSTHLFGKEFLPRQLVNGWIKNDHYEHEESDTRENNQSIKEAATKTNNRGKGKLIVVIRNLKDAMCSLHHFRGVPADGWDGNEYGPGSYQRYINTMDCPNAMGSAFQWIKSNSEFINEIGPERALVVYYESLKLNFEGQLKRINDFLGLPPLTEAKKLSILNACSFTTMKRDKSLRSNLTARKGEIGDWVNHLNEPRWAEFDRVFNKELNGVEIAEPLRYFQFKDVPGMPLLSLKECDLYTDHRTWPPYLVVMLQEGMLVPDPLFLSNALIRCTKQRKFNYASYPSTSLCLNQTNIVNGSPRYHLFVAASCPLSSSVSAARTLLGLDNVVSMDVSDGQSGAGWVFLSGVSCDPWKGRGEGPFWLYEVYQSADELCTSRITVPVLWDTETGNIVSNDSWEIMKLFSDAVTESSLACCGKDVLDAISKDGDKMLPTLFPDNCKKEIEQVHSDLYDGLLNSINSAGMEYFLNGRTYSLAVLEARKDVFKKLEELESLLDGRRFLLGDCITGVDVCLAMLLLHFDGGYLDAFILQGCDDYKGPIMTGDAYPKLKSYVRVMYRYLKPSVRFESFRQLFQIPQSIEFTNWTYGTDESRLKKYDNQMNGRIADLKEILISVENTTA